LISAPGTSGAGHAIRSPSASLPGPRACCQRHGPSRWRGLVNDRDPVMAGHLAGGEPGPVAKPRLQRDPDGHRLPALRAALAAAARPCRLC